MIHLLPGLKNFGRSLDGQAGPTRGSRVLIQSFKWKPAICAKTYKKYFNQSPKSCKRLMGLLLGKQSSHQTQRNDKKLTSKWIQAANDCTPLAPTRNKIIHKTACSDVLKTGFALKGPSQVKPCFAFGPNGIDVRKASRSHPSSVGSLLVPAPTRIYFFDGWRVRPCIDIPTDLPPDPPEHDT